jgi:hypothetical protein
VDQLMRAPGVVGSAGAVTAAWMTEVLRASRAIGEDGAVSALRATSIGTGQIGDNVRFSIQYEGTPGPRTVVCKFGSSVPASAAAGVQMRLYETEVAFYRELADTVEVARPHCYFAAVTPGTADAVLVMEDLAPAVQGDQIEGCGVAEAGLAVDEAARLHGPRWGDPTLGELEWLASRGGGGGGLELAVPLVWEGFVERYGSRILPVTLEAGRELAALGPHLSRRRTHTLTPTHTDFRLDNMLFASPSGGRPIVVVDWQTVGLGTGVQDVAYFLGNAFAPEIRRSCEAELVARYHRRLVGDYAVEDYPLDQCWSEYVSFSYSSLAMAVFASMTVGRTDRGDAMFMAMANRSAQMAADLDAAALIRSA